jgi:hypothetical protein
MPQPFSSSFVINGRKIGFCVGSVDDEVHIVTCMSDHRRGFGLEIGLIDHFHTRHVNTLNYSAIADIHTLKITTAHVKSFQSAFSSRFPVTDLNNGDLSTALSKSSFHIFIDNF